jgi:hypothetical protein
MTIDEKLHRLSVLISPDTADDDLLLYLLEQAEGIVLNRRYPFGPPEGASIPAQYEHTQVQIALELFSKMGAEGQVQHIEGSVTRTWEAGDVSPSLLKLIVPCVGSVG